MEMEKHLIELIEKDDLKKFKIAIESGKSTDDEMLASFDSDIEKCRVEPYDVNKILDNFQQPSNFSSVNYVNFGFTGYYEGITLLHYACSLSLPASSSIRTITIDVKDPELIYIAPLKIITYLLEKGANVNMPDTDGRTPLHFACQNTKLFHLITKESDSEIYTLLKLLLDYGADVNMKCGNSRLKTPLYLFVKNCERVCFYVVNKVIRLFVQNGSNLYTNNNSDISILTISYCQLMELYRDMKRIEVFDIDDVEQYKRLNWRDRRSPGNPLIWDQLPSIIELMEYLIDNGANVNTRNSERRTILHHAVVYGPLEHCKKLIEKGADYNLMNAGYKTPQDIVIYGDRIKLIKYFTDLSIKVNNLSRSDLRNLKRIIYIVTDYDVEPHYNVIQEFFVKGKNEVADALVRKGLNCNKYSIHTKLGKQYQNYINERKITKRICKEKKIAPDIEKNILDYLGKDTICETTFLFPTKYNNIYDIDSDCDSDSDSDSSTNSGNWNSNRYSNSNSNWNINIDNDSNHNSDYDSSNDDSSYYRLGY